MTTHHKIITSIGGLLALIGTGGSCLGVDTNVASGVIFVDDLRACLDSPDITVMESRIPLWASAPDYQKMSVADILTDSLLSTNRILNGTKPKEPTGHDLETRAGKAAWALENIYGVTLHAVTPSLTSRDQQGIHSNACSWVQEYRGRKLKDDRLNGMSLDELRAKYKGKIVPGMHGKDSRNYSARMEQLLGDWLPIGKTIDELQSIVGSPGTKVASDAIIYVFDFGFSSRTYRFELLGNEIMAVFVL